MANKTKTANQDQVSTSSSKTRSNSKQVNSNESLNQRMLQNDERLQEKKEMRSLNDRLALQLQRERDLKKDKLLLIEQLKLEKDQYDNKIEECKLFYENQLTQLRNKLDSESTNSAKKLLEFEKYKALAKELEKEKNVLVNDLKQFEKRNNLLLNENEKLKDKLNHATEENSKYYNLVQSLEQEKNSADKASKRNLQQAEQEKLRSISLEGKLKGLEDQLKSQKHFYEKEIEEVKARCDEERDLQIEEEVQNEVDCLATELMIKSKRELEENVNKIRQDLERHHYDELQKLKDQLYKATQSEKSAISKMKSNQAYISKLKQIKSALNSRIAELESLLEIERNEKLELLEEKERELKELEDELRIKDNENQLVLDSNVQLKEEIQIYRNLLDEQEKSLEDNELQISSSNNQNQQQQQVRATRSSTPSNARRYAQPVRKRKRNTIDLVNETTIINKSVGPIAIDESTDHFIRLVNRHNEPIPLGNWELNRQNEEDGYTFRFHKAITLQPNEMITVFSVDAPDAIHNPPVAIKMKKNWPVGGVTILSNPEKEEIAKWEYSSSSKRGRFNGAVVEQENDRSCLLM